jgi:hypothetical protein
MAKIGLAKMAVTVALALALGWAGTARATMPAVPPETLCSAETARFERQYGIPAQLLDAISVVESGRYDRAKRATLAWPWTVTAEGNGKYFPTKTEAVAEVKRLKARGVKNIDVGCMQVNLYYHPDAFSSVEDAFEPSSNVAYAARFLKGLFSATNHWITAASYYHSQTPHLAAAYRDRLMKVWNGPGAGTATRTARATSPAIAPVKPAQNQLKPMPSSRAVEDVRQAWKAQDDARTEARAIAAAYRTARLAEYQLRRAKMMDVRRALGRSPDGY